MKKHPYRFSVPALLLTVLILLSACSTRNSPATQPPTAAEIPPTAQPTEPPTSPPTETTAPETQPPTAKPGVLDGRRSDPDDPFDATGFVSLTDVIPDVVLDLRYYSDYNFVGERIDGYEEPVALLSKEAAGALSDAADDLRAQGYLIVVYDAYRPQKAVDHFARWASDPSDTRMKADFYPDIDKSLLFDYGYIAYRSGHSRGCRVDISLYDIARGEEVDMGGPFDFFGELSHPDYRGITDAQYHNRMLLRDAMVNNGFYPCSTEWWDFTLDDEPYPYTYFNFPVSLRSLGD